MAEYLTEQKRMLMGFLSENRESAYSIEELIGELRIRYGNAAPGKSTVYRLVTNLVKEDKIKRFVRSGRSFAYQIVECSGEHSHLHLKCVDCGKLIHLDSDLSDKLIGQVAVSNNFSVNEEATVLFGTCADCKGR